MKRVFGMFTALLAVFLFFSSSAYAESSVPVMTLDGSIGYGTNSFLKQVISDAKKSHSPAVIIALDTPGGALNATRQMVQTILSSPVPIITYVSPNGARASSAGLFLVYASHLAYMAPVSQLGAATPVMLGASTSKDPDSHTSTLLKKANSDAVALIRSLAKTRQRNAEPAIRAVNDAESFTASEAFQHNMVNGIAGDLDTVLQMANGQAVLLQGKRVQLHLSQRQPVVVSPGLVSSLMMSVSDPSVAYVLFLVGCLALLVEFLVPGLFLPGALGVVCLLLAAYAFYALATHIVGVLMLVVGLALIVFEFLAPSFGVLLLSGLAAFIFGSILVLSEGDMSHISWQLVMVMTGVLLSGVFVLTRFALRARRQPLVSGTASMLGKEGTIVMRAGEPRLYVDGELWQIKSDSTVSEGEQVVIRAIEGLTVEIEQKEKLL